jgi:L-asparagine transporter-like permease
MWSISMEDHERADQQQRLKDTRDAFTAHAALYVLVMAALLVLNLFLTGYWWSVIVLVSWGIVLALHYLIVRRVGTADTDRQARTEKRAGTAKPAA